MSICPAGDPAASSRPRRRTYVLPDPGAEYSLALVDRLFVHFGLRPVCLYPDHRRRAAAERTHPVLRGHLVETALVAGDPVEAASRLRDRFDVVAVIPHQEEHVVLAGALGEALGVQWNSPAVLAPFRDKLLLKRVLAAGGVRVPAHRPLVVAADVDDPALAERLVLKPNDGVGNRAVGFFARGDVAGVQRHLDRHQDERWILEEHIAGPEFSVNGQVRADGTVVVYGVIEYERAVVGECPTVYSGEWVCPASHPLRDAIVEYARAAVGATGLRRSPFHLEVKVDERGPCVVDLAARFGGAGLVPAMARSAAWAIDPFTLAAHDYVGSNALDHVTVDPPVGEDRALFVYGLAHEPSVVHQLVGCETVEAHPAFVRWVAKPYLGQRIETTQALYSTPYIVDMRDPATPEDRRALIDEVRREIRWNVEPAPVRALAHRARLQLRAGRDRALDAAETARRRLGRT